MIGQLKYIRNQLLENNNTYEYKSIIMFFESPNEDFIDSIIGNLSESFSFDVRNVLNKVIDVFETETLKYRNEILYGQRIIWSQVLKCYEELVSVKKKMTTFRIEIYDDYLQACNEINKIFEIYAESQIEMSKFEDSLGVDRYLDTLCSDDIKPLEKLMSEIKNIFEDKIMLYRKIFTEKWSTVNISDIIEHQLINYNGTNQICTLFECNKKKTVLFIIDGFGFGQYQWYKNLYKGTLNYTYNENIFSWLSKVGCIKEYMLGSSYITDTGAGLAQIFSGKNAKDTGIISSKVGKTHANSFLETKKMDRASFENTFKIESNSITEIISLFDKKSQVFYGSRFNSNVSGFSEYIFKGAKVMQVLPPERMLNILKDDLCKEEDGLDVVYLTGIDNSGHTMGAYSKFEKFEHEKFNMLFRNFLIEMAIEHPQYFNGKTTFLITADHGMAESSKLMISRKDIQARFMLNNIKRVNLIENNRALLVYGLEKTDYDNAVTCLNKYFNEIGVLVEIIVKDTIEYNNWYCTSSELKISILAPDIVIRLIGNGLFYSKETSPHLLHYGGHGGGSAGETFVPLLQVNLNDKLLQNITSRFINLL